MSRYQLLSDVAGTKVFVGWDTPLQTFFAQVLGTPKAPGGDPSTVLWVGTNTGECLSIQDLARQISPWATLPPGIAANLERERDSASSPTPLQTGLLAAMRSARNPR